MPWDSAGYREHKWAMVGRKGGKCQECNVGVTIKTLSDFQFHHKEKLANGHDKADRWGGGGRFLSPGSEEWEAFAETVELLCNECHRDRHRLKKQSSFDFEAQQRIDAFDPGAPPSTQLGFRLAPR